MIYSSDRVTPRVVHRWWKLVAAYAAFPATGSTGCFNGRAGADHSPYNDLVSPLVRYRVRHPHQGDTGSLDVCAQNEFQERLKTNAKWECARSRTPVKRAIRFLVAAILFICLLSESELHAQTMAPMTRAVAARYVGDDTYDGMLEPYKLIEVAAYEVGRLEGLTVSRGDWVKSGQIIGSLDDAVQRSAVSVAKSQTEMAADIAVATAELELAKNQYTKLSGLTLRGAVGPEELRRAATNLDLAKARLQSVEHQKLVRGEELKRAEANLLRRQVVAPADGIISDLITEVGEYVSPANPTVVELLIVDPLVAVVSIPAEKALGVQAGAPVRLTLRSTKENIEAEVESIAVKIDGRSGTVQLRCPIPNPDRTRLPFDRVTLQILAAGPGDGVDERTAGVSILQRFQERGRSEFESAVRVTDLPSGEVNRQTGPARDLGTR
ncbi:MAG: efflux RND transporter periplasmic adaptor subunit [Planctomycetota bacterium]